jgi:hypothetical protein
MLDESDIQRAVCQHLSARPSHFIRQTAVGDTSKRRALSGLVLGWALPLILLHDAKFHALELKAHAKSKVSKAQKQFIEDARASGARAKSSQRQLAIFLLTAGLVLLWIMEWVKPSIFSVSLGKPALKQRLGIG